MNRYLVKGIGWEVSISRHGVCDVVQLDPGEPIPVDAADLLAVGWDVVRCLRCGAEIVVTPRIAPVCRSCRD